MNIKGTGIGVCILWFQKTSIPSPWMEFQGRWGVSNAKLFKGKYEAELEFPEA